MNHSSEMFLRLASSSCSGRFLPQSRPRHAAVGPPDLDSVDAVRCLSESDQILADRWTRHSCRRRGLSAIAGGLPARMMTTSAPRASRPPIQDPQTEPGCLLPHLVDQQPNGSVAVCHYHIGVAVVVHITECRASADLFQLESLAGPEESSPRIGRCPGCGRVGWIGRADSHRHPGGAVPMRPRHR